MRSRSLAFRTDIAEFLAYLPALAGTQFQYHRYAGAVRQPGSANDIVVSLTSFPGRFGKLHNCIKSLLGQRLRPSKVVLYLIKEECRGIALPDALTRLQNTCFEIRFVDTNVRSLNKLHHALADFPDHTIVTCDDDKLYPADLLEILVAAHTRFPGCVVCSRSREIVLDENGSVAPYRSWPMVKAVQPSMSLLPMGVGGVLYPPGCLDARVRDVQLFLQLCPNADDLWLKVMAVLAGTPAVQAGPQPRVYPSIPFWNGQKLSPQNIWNDGNNNALTNLVRHFRIPPEAFREPAS
ncbi:hypothetical protein [Anderseniella sp. Alg231-50]|uniref:hypothetical protein n=1 Tax=Anderseniella sp. Alg231-50 TaxID=1922226 RepID=UPI00307BE4ED